MGMLRFKSVCAEEVWWMELFDIGQTRWLWFEKCYDLIWKKYFLLLNCMYENFVDEFFFRRGEYEPLKLGPIHLTSPVPNLGLTCNAREATGWNSFHPEEEGSPVFRASSPSPWGHRGEPPHQEEGEGGDPSSLGCRPRERGRERERAEQPQHGRSFPPPFAAGEEESRRIFAGAEVRFLTSSLC